jgi:hypothetical protein
MQVTGWSRGVEISGGGQGVVSHAGPALLRQLADKTGLLRQFRHPGWRGISRWRLSRP